VRLDDCMTHSLLPYCDKEVTDIELNWK